MTIEQVRAAYEQQPFQPFSLHLADGRVIHGYHRDFIMSAPTGRTLAVYQPDGVCNIIDLLLVTDLELQPPAPVTTGSRLPPELEKKRRVHSCDNNLGN